MPVCLLRRRKWGRGASVLARTLRQWTSRETDRCVIPLICLHALRSHNTTLGYESDIIYFSFEERSTFIYTVHSVRLLFPCTLLNGFGLVIAYNAVDASDLLYIC
jgi:hypothetical protein